MYLKLMALIDIFRHRRVLNCPVALFRLVLSYPASNLKGKKTDILNVNKINLKFFFLI